MHGLICLRYYILFFRFYCRDFISLLKEREVNLSIARVTSLIELLVYLQYTLEACKHSITSQSCKSCCCTWNAVATDDNETQWPRFVDCFNQDIASDNYCDIILLTNSLKNVAKLILYAFVEFLNILIICFNFLNFFINL